MGHARGHFNWLIMTYHGHSVLLRLDGRIFGRVTNLMGLFIMFPRDLTVTLKQGSHHLALTLRSLGRPFINIVNFIDRCSVNDGILRRRVNSIRIANLSKDRVGTYQVTRNVSNHVGLNTRSTFTSAGHLNIDVPPYTPTLY